MLWWNNVFQSFAERIDQHEVKINYNRAWQRAPTFTKTVKHTEMVTITNATGKQAHSSHLFLFTNPNLIKLRHNSSMQICLVVSHYEHDEIIMNFTVVWYVNKKSGFTVLKSNSVRLAFFFFGMTLRAMVSISKPLNLTPYPNRLPSSNFI